MALNRNLEGQWWEQLTEMRSDGFYYPDCSDAVNTILRRLSVLLTLPDNSLKAAPVRQFGVKSPDSGAHQTSPVVQASHPHVMICFLLIANCAHLL